MLDYGLLQRLCCQIECKADTAHLFVFVAEQKAAVVPVALAAQRRDTVNIVINLFNSWHENLRGKVC